VFDAKPVNVTFLIEVAMRQVYLPVCRFSPVTITPQMRSTHPPISHTPPFATRRHLIVPADNALKESD
jgi:hypothetical protein